MYCAGNINEILVCAMYHDTMVKKKLEKKRRGKIWKVPM
jgi:stalled ribosome alternative rescue factor ArfA